MIYSFDSTLDSKIIEELKINYKIKEVPLAIINGKKFYNIKNIRDLDSYSRYK